MVCLFVKQKTAYEMRISDWSSDVCSSDLPALEARDRLPQHRHDDAAGKRRALEKRFVDEFRGVAAGAKLRHSDLPFAEEVDAKAPVALDMFSGDRRFVVAYQTSKDGRFGEECVSQVRSGCALQHSKKKNRQ